MKRILFAAVLAVMLFAGLLPFGSAGFRPAERVEEPEPGLRFFGKSLVYTKELPEPSGGDPDGLTILLEMTPFPQEKPEFGAILMIFDTASRTRLTIGQWDDSLMVLAGDDFSNRRREPKIYAALPSFGKMQIAVVSDGSGTRLFIDGEPAGDHPALFLKYPERPDQSHLVLGSGIPAWYSWEGVLHSLEIHGSAAGPGPSGIGTAPLASYRLVGGEGSLIPDEAAHGPDLLIARQRIQLDRRFLRMPELHSLNKGGMPRDLFLNFFGFMPFGLLLFSFLREKNRRRIAVIAGVLAASFLLSLTIESLQVLMPARDSSLLDLILNSLGGASGGFLAGFRRGDGKRRDAGGMEAGERIAIPSRENASSS